MSNRSLIEINHDYVGTIDKAREGEFERALLRYLRSADTDSAANLERFGVRVFGMRHHSDGFNIEWGGTKATEPRSPA